MPFDFSFDVEDLARKLEISPSQIRASAAAAMFEHAHAVLADSQENYVPVNEAVLKGSGYVDTPKTDGDEISVTIGFGGPAKDYALTVHEYPDGPMPLSWSVAQFTGRGVTFRPGGRGPKFLERPLIASAQEFVDRLAAAIARRRRG